MDAFTMRNITGLGLKYFSIAAVAASVVPKVSLNVACFGAFVANRCVDFSCCILL